jgi:tRNA threonylcarbamoyladenosine biosynthesis protein TsaB
MSLILGIETSGLAGSVALSRGDVVLGQRSLEQAGRRHAQTLVAEIAALLASHKLSPTNLSAIGVTRGPGSFTGLRVGIVCAKTLSYALRLQLVLIDTFDIIAAQCPAELSDVWIVDDAQRQELYVGRYLRSDAGRWQLTGERFITPMRDWLARLPETDVVVGPGTPRIPSDMVSPRILREPAVTVPRAETICRLAAGKLAAGQIDDGWTAAPFYIRVSGAEEKAAKSAGGTDASVAKSGS